MIRSIRNAIQVLLDWKTNKELIKWLGEIGKNYRRYVVLFLAVNMLTMIVSLAGSLASRYAVDAATGFRTEFFWHYILIMLGASVLSVLVSAASGMLASYVNEKFAFGIRAEMFGRVQRSGWMELKRYHSGDMLARLSGDIDTVASSLISIVPNVAVTAVQLTLILIILLRNDPMLAFIGLVVGPAGALAAVAARKKYSYYQEKLKESRSEYYAFIQESLSNIDVVKAFQQEQHNGMRLRAMGEKRIGFTLKGAALGGLMSAGMRLIYGLGYVAAFSWCAYRLTTAGTVIDAAGNVRAGYTYGMMTLFLLLVSQLQGAVRTLGGVVPTIYSLLVSAGRIREITELEKDEGGIETVSGSVGIHAEDLSAAYDTEQGIVLENVNFEIPAGSRVGIVGASGAGKTTLIRLMLALIHPERGTLSFADAYGHKETVSPAARRLISYVPQGNTLYSGTVRENLCMGAPDADDEAMWKALEQADAAEFLRKMPLGLDTLLSEGAGGLSAGQAQRIAIARALLRDRAVLILDEATAALDEVSEERVLEKIAQKSERTMFIITHRKAALKYCDMVLEICNGTITLHHAEKL